MPTRLDKGIFCSLGAFQKKRNKYVQYYFNNFFKRTLSEAVYLAFLNNFFSVDDKVEYSSVISHRSLVVM